MHGSNSKLHLCEVIIAQFAIIAPEHGLCLIGKRLAVACRKGVAETFELDAYDRIFARFEIELKLNLDSIDTPRELPRAGVDLLDHRRIAFSFPDMKSSFYV